MPLKDHDEVTPAPNARPRAGIGGYLKLAFFGLVLAGLVAGALMSNSWRNLKSAIKAGNENLNDPGERARAAKRLLGVEHFPEGLFPAMSLRVDEVETVTLGNQLPNAKGKPNTENMERGFTFARFNTPLSDHDEVLAYFEDKGPNPKSARLGFNAGRLVRTGRLQVNNDIEVRYRLGRRPPPPPRGPVRNHKPMLVLEFLPLCPDGLVRRGIWFVPDPAPTMKLTAQEAANTPFDENSVIELLEKFVLCSPAE